MVASGPSAKDADLERCRRYGTIVVNDGYRLAPWADVLYACDPEWWAHHHGRVAEAGFTGEKWTQDAEAAKRHGLCHVEGHHNPGLSKEPGVIHFNGNGGAQALNLAVIWGARRIILVGFDMKRINGEQHWFGNHPPSMVKASDYGPWVHAFTRIAADLKAWGIEVINCSPVSALHQFRKARLEEVCPLPSA